MLDNSLQSFFPEDDPGFRAMHVLEEVFGSDHTVIYLLESDDVFSPETLRLVRGVTKALEESETLALREVSSLATLMVATDNGTVLDIKPLLAVDVSVTPQELKRRAIDNPAGRRLVSNDGQATAVIGRFKESDISQSPQRKYDVLKEARRILGVYLDAEPGVQLRLVGGGVLDDAIQRGLRSDLLTLLPIAALLLALLLRGLLGRTSIVLIVISVGRCDIAGVSCSPRGGGAIAQFSHSNASGCSNDDRSCRRDSRRWWILVRAKDGSAE